MRISFYKNFKRKFDEWKIPYLGGGSLAFTLGHTNEGTERATKLLLHSTSMIMKKIVQNCNFSRCGPLAFSFHEGEFLLCLYEEKMWLCSVHLFPKENEKTRVFLSNGKDLASLRPWVFWGPHGHYGALKAYKWHYYTRWCSFSLLCIVFQKNIS